jgi:hypothetical protein
LKKQIIYTVAYCMVILAIAAYLADKRRKNHQLEEGSIEIAEFNFETDLPGNWISPSLGATDPELSLQFDSHDSLFLKVDGATYSYSYEIESPDVILVWDKDTTIKFDWTIIKLNSDSLTIGDRNGIVKLARAGK